MMRSIKGLAWSDKQIEIVFVQLLLRDYCTHHKIFNDSFKHVVILLSLTTHKSLSSGIFGKHWKSKPYQFGMVFFFISHLLTRFLCGKKHMKNGIILNFMTITVKFVTVSLAVLLGKRFDAGSCLLREIRVDINL